MKWRDAGEILPAMYEVVLVKDINRGEHEYCLCQLAAAGQEGNPYALEFRAYSDIFSHSIEIKKGTLWARVTLPKNRRRQ